MLSDELDQLEMAAAHTSDTLLPKTPELRPQQDNLATPPDTAKLPSTSQTTLPLRPSRRQARPEHDRSPAGENEQDGESSSGDETCKPTRSVERSPKYNT